MGFFFQEVAAFVPNREIKKPAYTDSAGKTQKTK